MSSTLLYFQKGNHLMCMQYETMCVDTSILTPQYTVQKDISIENIMNHTKGFTSLTEAENEGYVPLSVAVGIRTLYTNYVVQDISPLTTQISYYKIMANIDHSIKSVRCSDNGYDTLMYLTSVGVFEYLSVDSSIDNRVNEFMMKYSQYQCVGLYYNGVNRPMILNQIIIKDEGVTQLKELLKESCSLVPIRMMNPVDSLSGILDSYIFLKRGENDG